MHHCSRADPQLQADGDFPGKICDTKNMWVQKCVGASSNHKLLSKNQQKRAQTERHCSLCYSPVRENQTETLALQDHSPNSFLALLPWLHSCLGHSTLPPQIPFWKKSRINTGCKVFTDFRKWILLCSQMMSEFSSQLSF